MAETRGARRIRVLPSADEVTALLARVRPPQDRLDLARDLPAAIRAHLQKTKRITTIAPHTRLAGSYGRHVSTHQIKDVDIMVFLDPKCRDAGPQRALEDLEAAATVFQNRRRRGAIDRRAQRRSVRLAFNEDDFSIDLVPALAPQGAEAALEIPDRDRGRWVKTASIKYGKTFSDLNGACNEQLVPLVQLVRHWALMHCSDVRVKGFWLEALLVRLVTTEQISMESRPLLEIMADAIEAMYELCSRARTTKRVPEIPDPVLGTNVAALWMKDEFDAFFGRLRDAHAVISRARSASDAATAMSAWQELFGADYLVPNEKPTNAVAWLVGVGAVAAAVFVGLLMGRKR